MTSSFYTGSNDLHSCKQADVDIINLAIDLIMSDVMIFGIVPRTDALKMQE